MLAMTLVCGAQISWADTVNATLDHTAGSGWSSAAGEGYTVDSESEYYNMDIKTGWAGAAFAQFSFTIPEGHSVTSAKLTWACNQYNGKKYTSEIYYLNSGVSINFNTFVSDARGSELMYSNQKTWICKTAALQGAKKTGKLHTGLVTDVTEAVKAIVKEGQKYIIFQWTGNSGSADLKGKGDATNKPVLVIETADENTTVSYTVNFIDESGTKLKEPVVHDGQIKGNTVNASDEEKASFFNEGKTKKYILKSGDSPLKLGEDVSSNEINLVFREAATYSYSLVSDKGVVLNSGSNFEGETLPISFPRYYFNKSDSTLYEAQALGEKKLEYRKSITLDANDKQETIAYNKSTKNRIAFYTEGEDIPGATDANAPKNIPGRASNARAAKTKENLYVTSLPAGKYIIHVGCFTYSSKDADIATKFVKLALGDRLLSFQCANANLSEVASAEVAISKTSQLVFLADGSSDNSALDYLYIEKTGNVVESNGEDFIPGDGPTYDPDKAPEGGIESATRPEHGMATSPSDTTQNDNTNGTATGINGAEAEAQIVSIVNVNGAKVNSLQKGINIVTYSNGKRVKIMK